MVGNLGIFPLLFCPSLSGSEGQQLSGKIQGAISGGANIFSGKYSLCSANIFLKNTTSDRKTEAEKHVFLNTSGDRGRVAQLSHVPFRRGGATNSHYEQYGPLVSAFSL